MERDVVEREVRRLVIEARGAAATNADDSTIAGLTDDIDSLEGIEAILAAEERFGVTIPDEELSLTCRSIRQIADAIARQLAQQGEKGTAAR